MERLLREVHMILRFLKMEINGLFSGYGRVTPGQFKELLPGLNPGFKFPRSQTEVGKTLDEFMSGYAIEYLE